MTTIISQQQKDVLDYLIEETIKEYVFDAIVDIDELSAIVGYLKDKLDGLVSYMQSDEEDDSDVGC